MINKYIVKIVEDYDKCYECSREQNEERFIPIQSNYSKEEIQAEYDKKIGIFPFRVFTLLDTDITIYHDYRLSELLTIQEWFTKYATGVKETRDDVDKKISSQYTNK